MLESKNLKIFVWDEVLSDQGNGLVIGIANSIDELLDSWLDKDREIEKRRISNHEKYRDEYFPLGPISENHLAEWRDYWKTHSSLKIFPVIELTEPFTRWLNGSA